MNHITCILRTELGAEVIALDEEIPPKMRRLEDSTRHVIESPAKKMLITFNNDDPKEP